MLSLFVNLGMWFERFVIICTSLTRDFLPSSWGYFSPTVVDIFTFFGTFGVFSVLFPPFHPLSSPDGHRRIEGCDAAGRSARRS